MTRSNDALSVNYSRATLLSLGGLYVALAIGYVLLAPADESSLGIDLVMLAFVGGPGAVVFAGGYRLPRADIRPEVFAVVAKWAVGGIVVMLVLLAITTAAAGVRDVVQNALILTALGCLAGFAAGSYDARARTREIELRETVEQLQTANDRLERFTYATSHDLQEPLRMISTNLQLLETRHGDDLDDDAMVYVDYATASSERMRAMVESLYEYSRVTTRDAPLEPTDAEAALEAALDSLRERIDEADATITVDDLPTVRADEDQLICVFRNLLSNALKYSGDDPPRVHVGAERRNGAWQFAVSDQGIGIDPDYHDRIFEVFEGLHAGGEEPDPDAVGIGLALCERIVDRHGGEIWVDSESGDGATVSFTVRPAGKADE